jgi:dTDP-4-dehydrorhamnose 3,5-epimerase
MALSRHQELRMNVIRTAIPDVVLLEPKVFGDNRGFFMESFNARAFADATGYSGPFVQDNHSRSGKGVLRGLHYQLVQPQGKLVRVTLGEVFDVAVDMRRRSPTFGQAVWATLSAENKRLFWIPPGFAHGFLVLSDVADFLYKTTDYYAPQHERSMKWDDPALGIPWPLEALGNTEIKLSEKDRKGVPLAEADAYP